MSHSSASTPSRDPRPWALGIPGRDSFRAAAGLHRGRLSLPRALRPGSAGGRNLRDTEIEVSRREKTMTSNNTTSVLEEQDSAVRAVFGGVSRAGADGDAEAFTGWYADHATVILPALYLPGSDALRASMAAAFAGPLKGSRRSHEGQSTRFRDDGTAIRISNTATVFPAAAKPPAAP